MNKISLTRKFAITLLKEHSLDDWKFKISRKMKTEETCGLCNHTTRIITLSRSFIENDIDTERDIRYLILHEIAHALVGEGHGHDDVWASKCVYIGGNGRQFFHKSHNE